jgi:2,3,4,5-tetrahydropyridine-2-carboxylate N-succinyltransferase
MEELRQIIETAFARGSELEPDQSLHDAFARFKTLLNAGEIRAAEKHAGQWQVLSWVKKGVLLGFRLGELVDYSIDEQFRYFDKSTYPLKQLTLSDGVRQVPGGSSIRDGCYVAKGVVLMPPAYINVAAYVEQGTMIDSHALVGSCAQIGKRVHLSAGCQIGGVLEPIGAVPVIVEDDVLVGGNSGIYDGTIVQQHAVIGAGTILTGSTPVIDLVKREIYRRTQEQALIIPAGAVVVPGTRKLENGFAKEQGVAIYTPVIIKYRDQKTASVTALEDSLR